MWYYILILALAGILAMARKGRARRKFRRYIPGVVNVEKDAQTLTAKTIIIGAFPEVVTERCWISSIDAAWTLMHHTKVADAGPLLIGVAHSDYTAGEIEQYLENVDSWDQSDKVQSREIGRRLIRQIGIFETPDAITDTVRMNDGKKIHTKCGFWLATGQTLSLFIYNLGGQSLSGTGNNTVHGRGVAHLWPR